MAYRNTVFYELRFVSALQRTGPKFMLLMGHRQNPWALSGSKSLGRMITVWTETGSESLTRGWLESEVDCMRGRIIVQIICNGKGK